MNRHEIESGLVGGLIAAAATGGALISIGRRVATPWRPFNIMAAHLVGQRAGDYFEFQPRISLLGIALHLIVCMVLGLAVLLLVNRHVTTRWPAAIAMAVLCALISIGWTRRGGLSLAGIFPVWNFAVYYVVLAAGLAFGNRFARPVPEQMKLPDDM